MIALLFLCEGYGKEKEEEKKKRSAK